MKQLKHYNISAYSLFAQKMHCFKTWQENLSIERIKFFLTQMIIHE